MLSLTSPQQCTNCPSLSSHIHRTPQHRLYVFLPAPPHVPFALSTPPRLRIHRTPHHRLYVFLPAPPHVPFALSTPPRLRIHRTPHHRLYVFLPAPPHVPFALSTPPRLRIRSLDAAQPYNYESQISDRLAKSTKLKIAIIGFGNFGQFLAKTLVRQGHTVLAHSRSNHNDIATKLGISFFSDGDDLCEEHPDVMLLCTSIISTERVLRSLPLQRLKRSTLFVDVLSVKEFPRNLFMQILPFDFDILCTHPMFGPESGKDGWYGLPFVYDKVRIGSDESRASRCERFLEIFVKEGCRMMEMTCAEHDRHAAGSQFITHKMGRVLEKLRLEPTPINTKGYETLLNLVENAASDSFDLYYGLFMYNKNAMEQLERLDLAVESLKKELFGHLHDVLRKQLFGKAEALDDPEERPMLSKLPKNGAALPPPMENVRAEKN